MLDERKFAVLRAIVTDYVATQEPVGSKALVERHQLGVSPATVRNDMAALEDEGYIAQPHTSAGRIPTDRGYRLFVDNLSAVKPLSAAERRAIESFLSGAVDLDDVVGRTVRLLAQLTRQVAVVRYPSLSVSTVRHIETVPLSTTRLMLVLITSNGRVDQSVVEVPAGLDDGALAELRRRVNESAAGRRLADAVVDIASLTESVPPEQRALFAVVAAGLTDVLLAQREERVVMGGAANLAAFGPDLGVTVQPVLEALEEQVVLLHLLGDSDAGDEVTVRIGAEQPEAKLRTTSVVSTHYGAGDSAARLGVIGPTRMDYPATMAAVGAVARYVSRILAEA